MFKQYRRKQIAELRSVTQKDIDLYKARTDNKNISNASNIYIMKMKIIIAYLYLVKILKPVLQKLGDMIARNPKNHKDQWLVAKEYFNDNFEELI